MEKVPMTATGLVRLEADLKHYKMEERPAIIRAIAEARAHGDLSENAEYHAAKERQSFVEGQITEIESLIGRAEVIDVNLAKQSFVVTCALPQNLAVMPLFLNDVLC